MDVIPALALEIDRTVLSIGTNAGTRHREAFQAKTAEVEDEARRLLPRLAWFLLDGPIERSFVSERIPYTDVEIVESAIDGLLETGWFVDAGDGRVAAGDVLIPGLRVVVDGRIEMAEELWSGVADAADHVDGLAGAVRAVVPDEALVATVHAAIADPDNRWARLYERLTTVRYVRADAHRLAWRSFGCTGPLMVQLTTAWSGEQPTDVTLLENGGWWDGELTEEGRQTRDAIEDKTNELNAEFLSGVDVALLEDLHASLGSLPGTPVARPF